MRKTVFLGLMTAFLWALSSFGGEARAQNTSIQMLPPVYCPGYERPTEPVTIVPGKGAVRGILGWDGQNPMTCTGLTIGANNKLVAPGDIQANGMVDVGTTTTACSGDIAGAVRYNDDPAKRYMEYCDGTNWKAFGSKNCSQTSVKEAIQNTGTTLTASTLLLDAPTNAILGAAPGNAIIPAAPNGQIIRFPAMNGLPGSVHFQCVNGTFKYLDNDLGCRVTKNGSTANYKNGESWYVPPQNTPQDIMGDGSNCSCVKGETICRISQ